MNVELQLVESSIILNDLRAVQVYVQLYISQPKFTVHSTDFKNLLAVAFTDNSADLD